MGDPNPVHLSPRTHIADRIGILSILLLALILFGNGCASRSYGQNAQPVLPLAPDITSESKIQIDIVPEASMPEQENPKQIPLSTSSTYTIAWISDTQNYSAYFPKTFLTMTSYIIEKRQELNIGYVVHTGDLVASSQDLKQWALARQAMDKLGPIPYGVLAGNHDVGQAGDYSNFSAYFGEKEFNKYPYYGESLLDNRCHYDLISMGHTNYIFVYLGYEPGQESIRWANQAFRKYSDRVGILCVHEYLGSASELRDIGIALQDQIVKANPNIYLVLCGHRYNEDCVQAYFDDNGDGKRDRIVYQCIANYQNIDNQGGSGYMRFIQVDEQMHTLRFFTYSPLLDKYRPIPSTATCTKSILPIPWE